MKDQQILFPSLLLALMVTTTNPLLGMAQTPKLPTTAKLTHLTNGDLACYVNLVDSKGKKYENVYAVFEICEQKSLLNKRVKLFYQKQNFNDCQSAEPCGKTKKILAITKMELVR